MDDQGAFRVAAAAPDGLSGISFYKAVLAICIAISMAVLDGAIANTALPTIARNVHASAANSIWVVNAYQLAVTISLLPLASLGEIYGYRRVYVWGLVLFTLSSGLCALAFSIPTLIAARVLQGFGAAGIMSVNTALIRFIYPSRWLGRGIGNNALVVAVASAIGPTVASGILSVAPWPYLFAVNVPLGIAALLLGSSLPKTPHSGNRFDGTSALLNAATFGLLVFGVGEIAHGEQPLLTAIEMLGAVGFGIALVRRQLRLSAPLLPVDLFHRPIFALSAATAVCSFATQGLAYVALPFLFQDVLGHSQVETGLLMTPWPVVVAIMAPIAGRLSDRYPAGLLGGGGMAILSVGMLTLAFLPAHPGVWSIGWRMVVCGAGFGFYQSPNVRAIMESVPPARSGSASGIVSTARLLGQTMGAALVALCFTMFPHNGTGAAMLLGAGFAGTACIVSFLRLMDFKPVEAR
jgi:DHA2 family multidrug resistance protein-like MFS transporter